MDRKVIYQKLAEYKIIPVIAIERVENALPLADALIAGGLPVIEITFRTKAAAAVIQLLKKERPDLILGAGTILTVDQLKSAVDSGAVFGVAPGFNPKIVSEAMKLRFPFSPGIMTPSDIEASLEFGIQVMKFFPAEASGGLNLLKAIAAPYTHLGVQFMPTGGINIENLNSYMQEKIILAAGGTWLAKKDDISEGNWTAITNRCKEGISLVS